MFVVSTKRFQVKKVAKLKADTSFWEEKPLLRPNKVLSETVLNGSRKTYWHLLRQVQIRPPPFASALRNY